MAALADPFDDPVPAEGRGKVILDFLSRKWLRSRHRATKSSLISSDSNGEISRRDQEAALLGTFIVDEQRLYLGAKLQVVSAGVVQEGGSLGRVALRRLGEKWHRPVASDPRSLLHEPIKLAAQKHPCQTKISLDGPCRHTELLCDLAIAQTPENFQINDLALTDAALFQLAQRLMNRN